MNKQEFKAINMIASKMNWQNKPVECVIEAISQMVRNQQALELDCVGKCSNFGETLLSIALWNRDKIVSTMYVADYTSLIMWGAELFKEDMGLDSQALTALFNWEACKMNFLAPEYEMEDELEEDAYYLDCWYAMIETQLSCRY